MGAAHALSPAHYGNVVIFEKLPGTNKKGMFVAVNLTKVNTEIDRRGTTSGGDPKILNDEEMRDATAAAIQNPEYWLGEVDDSADVDEIGFFELDPQTGRLGEQVW